MIALEKVEDNAMAKVKYDNSDVKCWNTLSCRHM